MPVNQPTEPIRVGVRELRANLSALLRQARHGASILVMSRNQVVAEIRPPPQSPAPRRRPGALEGKIAIAADFDALPPDLLDAMEGEAD
jgi:antitoxin (DNA-binding transcriptional repressor) of toxin-antitoxin stability system